MADVEALNYGMKGTVGERRAGTRKGERELNGVFGGELRSVCIHYDELDVAAGQPRGRASRCRALIRLNLFIALLLEDTPCNSSLR